MSVITKADVEALIRIVNESRTDGLVRDALIEALGGLYLCTLGQCRHAHLDNCDLIINKRIADEALVRIQKTIK